MVPESFMAFCDRRNSSPSVAVDLNPTVHPQPGVQGGEPVEFPPIEPAPVIPELNPPLMVDMVRRGELQERLSLSFLASLNPFNDRLGSPLRTLLRN